MLTAIYSQRDRQTERFSTCLKKYLESYFNYLLDDCEEYLSMAKYIMNDHDSGTIGLSPFFANYRYNPQFQTNT